MFKKHSIEMKVVKNPTDPAAPVKTKHEKRDDLLFYNAMLNQNVLNLAKLVAIGYTGKKVLDTASEMGILTIKSRLK